jgi:hypothetical protein
MQMSALEGCREVLDLNPAPRLEQIDDEHGERFGRNHGMILPHDANPKPDGIFEKGQAYKCVCIGLAYGPAAFAASDALAACARADCGRLCLRR